MLLLDRVRFVETFRDVLCVLWPLMATRMQGKRAEYVYLEDATERGSVWRIDIGLFRCQVMLKIIFTSLPVSIPLRM